jgi:hypothetical protein
VNTAYYSTPPIAYQESTGNNRLNVITQRRTEAKSFHMGDASMSVDTIPNDNQVQVPQPSDTPLDNASPSLFGTMESSGPASFTATLKPGKLHEDPKTFTREDVLARTSVVEKNVPAQALQLRPLGVTDALSYLDVVKAQVQDQPGLYHRFLDSLEEFKAHV